MNVKMKTASTHTHQGSGAVDAYAFDIGVINYPSGMSMLSQTDVRRDRARTRGLVRSSSWVRSSWERAATSAKEKKNTNRHESPPPRRSISKYTTPIPRRLSSFATRARAMPAMPAVPTTSSPPAQRRAAVIAGAKHPHTAHHKHAHAHAHKNQARVQGRPVQKGARPAEARDAAGPPADAHVHGLEKLALNLKSWLYEWTKSGYEPL